MTFCIKLKIQKKNTRVDKMGVDEMGVDEMGVDEVKVDKVGQHPWRLYFTFDNCLRHLLIFSEMRVMPGITHI